MDIGHQDARRNAAFSLNVDHAHHTPSATDNGVRSVVDEKNVHYDQRMLLQRRTHTALVVTRLPVHDADI